MMSVTMLALRGITSTGSDGLSCDYLFNSRDAISKPLWFKFRKLLNEEIFCFFFNCVLSR